ncbi:Ankyrin repeat and sterile alpha motif like protein [Argiope bruennichi]|uniref:Ankyrin repeat and sterile alpha motif like protein n=1 Tax=Argiope bruennichi TaxID=94029 RepID=A0A8T0EC25_ARGBR|nr:Ankyrin repeat and sterile alpha motif like protein [Argiope bruennichi]
MGKEQELIDAARSGNIATVERYLSQRAKRSGPLASLRRGPGANAQDQSGYTSLHHAALNGHKEIVSLLLQYEASTNVVDHKGSTPLHLAAWTGNTDIVRMLLEQGPSIPNVNLANHDRETPLHSAAQYGHTEVVSLLLKHEADPNVRNLKDESPLDLAAQYGRLETVQLLVDSDPSLLKKCTTRHSPLHLASRNGHKNVVKVLLDGGFDVNYTAESGSALHEAALYGKVEVVKLLLDYGIDVNLENSSKRTVFDLLEDLNTTISKQISRIIRDHTTVVGKVDDTSKSPYSTSPPSSFSSVSTFVPTPEKQSSLLPLVRSGSPMSETTDTMCSYNSSKRSSTSRGPPSRIFSPPGLEKPLAIPRRCREGLRPDKPIPPAKPKTLDLRTKRQTIQIPLSPTHYQQPPTPDFPPPSPSTAALGIHEKIRPLSQEIRNKRVSRDIETLTEDELFATIDSGGHIRVSLRRENKSVSVSTDNIEEVVDDDPFAGLCRGSTVCPSSCPCDFQMSLRSQSATRQQHTYDNMLGMNTLPETRSSRNLRRESPCSDPGGQVSRSTSYDRSSVSDWGEGSAATTDSVFVRDMEETFARTLSRLRKEFQRSSFTSSFNTVEEWLKSLDLAIYTSNFVENGYDDIDFLGGNILEDDDLIEMNVSNKEHRQKILESCHSLPALKPISESQTPESVGEWLRSLHLDQYVDTFRRNGYTDMSKTKKLWDVELKSPIPIIIAIYKYLCHDLEITKPGHRKRILTSLGEKPTSRLFDELKDFSLSKLNMDMATEIILTLGQAFEVAYQMAIREKPEKSGKKSESGTASCGDDQKRVSSVLWRYARLTGNRISRGYNRAVECTEFKVEASSLDNHKNLAQLRFTANVMPREYNKNLKRADSKTDMTA